MISLINTETMRRLANPKIQVLKNTSILEFNLKIFFKNPLISGNYVSLLVVLITSSVETIRYETVTSDKTLMYMVLSIVILLYFRIVTTESSIRLNCIPDGFIPCIPFIHLRKMDRHIY